MVGRHWQSNVPLLTVSGELTRFRVRDRVRDNGTTLEATVSGHLNLTPIPVTRAAFPRYPLLPSIETFPSSFKSLLFHADHYSTLFSSLQALSLSRRRVFRGEAKPPTRLHSPLNPNKATPTIPVDKFVYDVPFHNVSLFSPNLWTRPDTPVSPRRQTASSSFCS